MWRHSRHKQWYELGHFISTRDMKSIAQSFRIQPYTFSDHMAKVGVFHFKLGCRKRWKGACFARAERYKTTFQPNVALSKGPVPQPRTLGCNCKRAMSRRVQKWLLIAAPQPQRAGRLDAG